VSTDKYCIIGDLHGRIETLDRILQRSPDYHYVFLGDTIHHKAFFRRSRRSSPTRMLSKIKSLTEEGQASFIIGNNENYILKNLVLPKSDIKQKEVKYTLECLKEMGLKDRLDLLHWLATAPLTLEFESYGKTYRCAHAYYKPDYDDKSRNDVLNGIGYPWFKNDPLEDHIGSGAEYFFGHYGYPYFRKNLRIIDATNFEGVGVYYTDREEFLIYY
jgi:hypothetical protein